MPTSILICDLIGLKPDAKGNPDPSEVKAHVEAKGGAFHFGGILAGRAYEKDKLHFFYLPELSTRDVILAMTGKGQFDAVIAAATPIPAESIFKLGGVRIGAGTGNMGSASWGGPNGIGGEAPLMNTPGFNARATAQMTMKALLQFRPTLPFAELHRRSVEGDFDTGKNLREYPVSRLEGQSMAIIGYGNIGREVAKLAAAFGMQVNVYARSRHHARIKVDGFEPFETVEAAARDADVISVHTGLGPLNDGVYANANLISTEILRALRGGATVLNFDRGECVDATALDQAMSSGQVAHAAIDADIFQSDGKLTGPLVPYLPLAKKFGARILLLPHAAADTDHPSRVAGAKQAVDQMFESIINKRVINLKGDLPPGYIDGGRQAGV